MKKNIFTYTLALAVMMLMTSCEKTSVEEYAQYMGWEVTDPGDDSGDDSDNNNQEPTIPTTHGEVVETGVVDLGLSVNWAACNLSESTENHFVENCANKGSNFSWSTSDINYPPASISGTSYDNATVLLGEGWRTPTKEEFQELVDNCYITYTSFRGQDGIKVTGPSGKTIFIPDYAEFMYHTGSYDLTEGKSIYVEISDYYLIRFGTYKYYGYSYLIRPVCDK